jgi:hypothetical protein
MKDKKGIILASIAAIAIAGVMVWRTMASAPATPDDALVQKNAELVKDTPPNPTTTDSTASNGSRRTPRKQ